MRAASTISPEQPRRGTALPPGWGPGTVPRRLPDSGRSCSPGVTSPLRFWRQRQSWGTVSGSLGLGPSRCAAAAWTSATPVSPGSRRLRSAWALTVTYLDQMLLPGLHVLCSSLPPARDNFFLKTGPEKLKLDEEWAWGHLFTLTADLLPAQLPLVALEIPGCCPRARAPGLLQRSLISVSALRWHRRVTSILRKREGWLFCSLKGDFAAVRCLCWICFPTGAQSRVLGALESPQAARPLPGLPRSRGRSRSLRFSRAARPRPLGPRCHGERAAQPRGSSGPRPARASGSACCDGDPPGWAPSTKLWVETLTSSHAGYQRITQRWGLRVTACLGWLWGQPGDGGSARHGSGAIPRSRSSLLPLANSGLFPVPPRTQKLSLPSRYSETDIRLRANIKRSKSPGWEIRISVTLLVEFINILIFFFTLV